MHQNCVYEKINVNAEVDEYVYAQTSVGSLSFKFAISFHSYGNFRIRFELTIFSEHYEASKGFESGKQTDDPLRVSRTLECRLVIDPYNFKTIAHWFTGLLNDFERLYGPIITPEERQQKAISTQTDKEKESSSNAYQ